MKIEINGKEVAYKAITFPDGQPHVIFDNRLGDYGNKATVTDRIIDGNHLLRLLLVEDVLRRFCDKVDLTVRYMLGARMDRPIDCGQPFTLEVVARILKSRFDNIAVVDPHSPVTMQLLSATTILPTAHISKAVRLLGWSPADPVAFVAPDKGAIPRVMAEAAALGGYRVVCCLKKRDSQTGSLSGFEFAEGNPPIPDDVLIVDDICDGGGTFTGVANLLREAGAKRVHLYVTHGIFSKGFRIHGIDRIFTTTSYRDREIYPKHIEIVD